MSHGPSDSELRDAFQELRRAERAAAPDAAAMLASARTAAEADAPDATVADAGEAIPLAGRRRRMHWAIPGVSVALAAALATLLLVDRDVAIDGSADAEFERVVEAWSTTGGTWRSPTDDLLRLPGDELLRTVPRIGGSSLPTDPRAPRPDRPERESPS